MRRSRTCLHSTRLDAARLHSSSPRLWHSNEELARSASVTGRKRKAPELRHPRISRLHCELTCSLASCLPRLLLGKANEPCFLVSRAKCSLVQRRCGRQTQKLQTEDEEDEAVLGTALLFASECCAIYRLISIASERALEAAKKSE